MNIPFIEAMYLVMPPDLLKQIKRRKAITKLCNADARHSWSEIDEYLYRAITWEML